MPEPLRQLMQIPLPECRQKNQTMNENTGTIYQSINTEYRIVKRKSSGKYHMQSRFIFRHLQAAEWSTLQTEFNTKELAFEQIKSCLQTDLRKLEFQNIENFEIL